MSASKMNENVMKNNNIIMTIIMNNDNEKWNDEQSNEE